jgi:4-aminobutyrate aminotransferase-like enzyme
MSNESTVDYTREIIIERGQRCHLYLTNGKCLLDLTSGATVANIGHGNKEISRCVARQASLIANTYLFNNIPRIKYKEELLAEINSLAGDAIYGEIFFLSSGSEIIDCAMKTAMIYTGKTRFASTPSSFHGRTLNGMGLSHLPFTKKVPENKEHPTGVFFPYPKNSDEEHRSLKELEDLLKQDDQIAGVILEPYQGDGGLLFPSSGYFRAVESLCRDFSVLFILDEIQSGFGRTGSLFYFSQLGIKPDILCLGKAIANGLPCSALVAPSRILSSINAKDISNSFGGNPMSMAAARKVLAITRNERFLRDVKRKGAVFMKGLKRLQSNYGCINDIRGHGLIIGVELNNSKNERIGDDFVNAAYENGLLLMPPKGAMKNVIKISPPLIISLGEINAAIEALEGSFLKIDIR